MTTQIAVRFLDRTTPPHIITLVLLSGMSALVMNIFVPSLQVMSDWYGVEYGVMQLSVSLFLGVNAVLQLIAGPMSDKLGRRPVILGGLAIFLMATIGCLLATDVIVFLIFRMIQSCIVVGMVLSRAAVRDLYPPDQAASQIGYVTMGMALVPMVAPMLGGVLTEQFGWHANFVAMLVFGLGVFWLSWRDFGETATRSGLSLWQQFGEYPELIRSPRFWGYSLVLAFCSGAFFAYIGGGAYVGSAVFGLTTAQVGYVFGAPAVGYATGNFFSGRYSQRFGINRMIMVGTTIATLGIGLSLGVFLMGGGSAIWFFGFMCALGLGNGLTIPNATAGAMSVRPKLAGTASGLAGAVMLAGGAALSQIAGMVMTGRTSAVPLLWMMFVSSLCSSIAIVFVIRRANKLAGLDAA